MTLSTEMTFNTTIARLSVIVLTLISAVTLVAAQHNSEIPLPPKRLPLSGDCYDDNIFYGAVPPGGGASRVLVFAHGLTGLAEDWWSANSISGLNNMYTQAYQAGYRTAFVNLNVDPDAPDCAVVRWPGNDMFENGYVLSRQLATITDHYNVNQVDIIAHSKGGIDAQSAIVWARAWPRVRSVFALGTPQQGSILADHLWSPEGLWVSLALGQLDEATFSLRTASMKWFRRITDASSINAKVDYYHGAGNFWHTPDSIYEFTGEWLQTHPDGGDNDGIVTVASTYFEHAKPLFVEAWNHTEVYQGSNAFPYIHQILLENEPDQFKVYLPFLVGLDSLSGSRLDTDEVPEAGISTRDPGNPVDSLTSSHVIRGGLLEGVVKEFIPVEPQADAVKFYLMTTDRDVKAVLLAPDGIRYPLDSMLNRGDSWLEDAFLFRQMLYKPTPGQWALQISGPESGAYFLMVSFDSVLQVQLSGLPEKPIQLGEVIQLTAHAENLGVQTWVDQIDLKTVLPTSGMSRSILLEEDVEGDDSLIHTFLHDGIYGMSITVRGVTMGELPFERTFIHSQAVIPVGKGENDLSALTQLFNSVEDSDWLKDISSVGVSPER